MKKLIVFASAVLIFAIKKKTGSDLEMIHDNCLICK